MKNFLSFLGTVTLLVAAVMIFNISDKCVVTNNSENASNGKNVSIRIACNSDKDISMFK